MEDKTWVRTRGEPQPKTEKSCARFRFRSHCSHKLPTV